MNLTIFTGNLGRDFDIHQTQTGSMVARNSLAVRRNYKNKSTGDYDTDWVPIVAFGKTAEIMQKHLGKGSKIGIEGSLRTSKYTDKQGNERTGYDVVVSEFEFLDSRNGQQSQQQTTADDNPFANVGQDSNPFQTQQQQVNDIPDDSFPF